MNLISQNCLAAEIYHITKRKYQNPFAQCVIKYDSMKYLIENWDNIDFRNYKIELSEDLYPIVILNDVCKIEYVHYRQSSEFDTPRKEGAFIFYNKIIDFTKETYDRRLDRMLSTNGKPIFCICNFDTVYKSSIYTKEQLEELNKFDNVKILTGAEKLPPNLAANEFFHITYNDVFRRFFYE